MDAAGARVELLYELPAGGWSAGTPPRWVEQLRRSTLRFLENGSEEFSSRDADIPGNK